MPIKNLTERRRLPRLGRIRIGEKVESKARPGVFYPHAVDYFVVPPEVAAVYGDKPKTLDIIFPLDNEETFASQYLRAYSRSRGLVCKGDGETASRLIDVATKRGEGGTGQVTGDIASHLAKDVEWVEGITCLGHDCPYYQGKDCREIMNLQFLLPSVPGLGVWQLDTSSFNSILNINSALALVRAIFGTVSAMPLSLTVEPIEVTPEGKKKTVYVLNLRTKATMNQLAQAKRLPAVSYGQPPPSDDEIPEGLFFTPEQEEARAEDEKVEIQAQAKKAIDALYGEGSGKRAEVKAPDVAPAVEASDDPFAVPAQASPSGKGPVPPLGIDLDWLKQSLERLQWTSVAKWLKDKYHVAMTQSIREMVMKLPFDQQREFAREVNLRLMELIEHPNTKGKQYDK